MDDTSPAMMRKMCELIQQKEPIERLKMGCSMYAFSRQLVISAILRDNPNISETELRVELFKKFYGDDFTPQQAVNIIAYLRQT